MEHLDGIQKMCKILRADPAIFEKTISAMENITGKKGVVEEVLQENDAHIRRALARLEVRSRYAEDIAFALEEAILHDDALLFDLLGKPDLSHPEHTGTLVKKAYEVAGVREKGLFLKKEKAREMIAATPPPAMIRGLGYRDARELLEKERLEEIFAALRFIETREWMNNIFVKEYEKLAPDDFEEREIELIVLPRKWLELAEKFLEKKYHNVSHLKELGVIFVIPITLDTVGETVRLFALMLHYLHEVPFYAKLTERYAKDPSTFALRLMSLIRGDVKEAYSENQAGQATWLIVQRYLAKDDENDARLFLPHVNPEAIHWRKAQRDLARAFDGEGSFHFPLFYELDYVGDFFESKKMGELLVSFDLVDNIMALVGREAMIKYLYHHQEALWNRIFAGFVGEENMETLVLDNLDRGFLMLGT